MAFFVDEVNTKPSIFDTKQESDTYLYCLPIGISSYHFEPSWSEVAEQLSDELSESEIPANSSGIKNNFWTNCTEVIFVAIVSGFVPNWHEVTSRQFGERCGIGYFTCS